MQDKRLEVLFIFGGEKASGAEIVVERLLRYSYRNFRSHLFIAPGTFSENLIRDTTHNYIISRFTFLKKVNRSSNKGYYIYFKLILNAVLLSIKVLNYCLKNNIKIVHANTVVPASYLFPAIFFSKIFHLKMKWFWTDHDMKYFSKVDHILSNKCVKVYNTTFTVSEAVKAKYKISNKIVTLYNGLDLNIFIPDIVKRKIYRTHLGIVENVIVFTIAGVISPRKGQLSLINTFISLLSLHKNIVLLIAGGTADDTLYYTKLVLEKVENNKTHIRYLGRVEDMVSLYNASDVIINNSNSEGSEPLGTTIYEAMSCEKLVIVSDTGGAREIITNKEDGFIFEVDNEKALYNMLDNVINKYDEFNDIKRLARKKVLNKFNINNMVAEYNSFLS